MDGPWGLHLANGMQIGDPCSSKYHVYICTNLYDILQVELSS